MKVGGNDGSDDAAIQGYRKRLESFLEACAWELGSKGRDDEVFLWNARRALEAICRILLHASPPKKGEHKQDSRSEVLHGLIEKVQGRVTREPELANRFELLRKHTNLGVHVRQPENREYRDAVADCCLILPGIVEWLVQESPAAGHLQPATTLLAVAQDIKEGRGRLPPREAHVEQLKADLESLKAELHETRRRLADSQRPPVDGAATSSDEGFLLPAAAARSLSGTGAGRRRWLAVVSVLVALGVGVAIGWSARSHDLTEMPPVLEPGAPSPGGLSGRPGDSGMEASRDATLRVASDASPDLRSAAGVAVSPCPSRMRMVPGEELRLGQPIGGRGGWPRPRREIVDPVSVHAFCIDRTEVSRAEFERSEVAPRASTTAACDFRRHSQRPGAVVCVSRDEAEAYCREATPGGQLPSIVQWEAVARLAHADVRRTTEREWVRDRFPPAVFNRRREPCEGCDGAMFRGDPLEGINPVGNVLFSWNKAGAARLRNLGFRCAVPARGQAEGEEAQAGH